MTREKSNNSKQFNQQASEQKFYVTYDMEKTSLSAKSQSRSRIKQIQVSGVITAWKVGHFAKRSGRIVKGVKVSYERGQPEFDGNEASENRPVQIDSIGATYSRIVEIPERATNIQCYTDRLP